mmetsp:Transcript_106995/g.169107  ORF Transcript_106995/g.169107 Transcript_106995/m.169107 type:complete len:414 (+) Transcript_106995:2-1243(+)
MHKALDAALSIEADEDSGHPMSSTSPVKMFGAMASIMPQHYTAILTSNVANQTDNGAGGSQCLDFDYSRHDGPDPAGCRFFQASFVPIQTMFKCVRRKLDKDPFWYLWQVIAKVAEKKLSEDDARGKLTLGAAMMYIGHLKPTSESFFTFEFVAQQAELYKAGKKGTVPQLKSTGTRLRALEMVKRVNFKPWDDMDIQAVKALLKAKIPETKTAPGGNGALMTLLDDTTSEIMSECFLVPDFLEASSGNQSYRLPPVPSKALFLKEAISCFPLMWDAVEVPAAPTQPLTMPSNDALGAVDYDFAGVMPLCGRIVLAGLHDQFTRARYPYYGNLLLHSFSPNLTHTDNYCFNPPYATCRSFVVCWTKMMYNYGYQIHPACRVDGLATVIWNELGVLGDVATEMLDEYGGIDPDY